MGVLNMLILTNLAKRPTNLTPGYYYCLQKLYSGLNKQKRGTFGLIYRS